MDHKQDGRLSGVALVFFWAWLHSVTIDKHIGGVSVSAHTIGGRHA